MITHRCSGLLISKFAFKKLFRYLINCAGVTQKSISTKSWFLSHSLNYIKNSGIRKLNPYLKIKRAELFCYFIEIITTESALFVLYFFGKCQYQIRH